MILAAITVLMQQPGGHSAARVTENKVPAQQAVNHHRWGRRHARVYQVQQVLKESRERKTSAHLPPRSLTRDLYSSFSTALQTPFRWNTWLVLFELYTHLGSRNYQQEGQEQRIQSCGSLCSLISIANTRKAFNTRHITG